MKIVMSEKIDCTTVIALHTSVFSVFIPYRSDGKAAAKQKAIRGDEFQSKTRISNLSLRYLLPCFIFISL